MYIFPFIFFLSSFFFVSTDVRSARKDGMDALKKAKSAVSEDITRRLSKEVRIYSICLWLKKERAT